MDVDDDDFVFEPSAWDMAFEIGLRPDATADRAALDELADAMLVSMGDGPLLERLTDEAMAALWPDEVPTAIREGLVELCGRDDWQAGAAAALAEFDRAPREADVTREVVRHLAMHVGNADAPFFFCLDCLEEAAGRSEAGERRELATRVAIVARRNAAVPADELRPYVTEPRRADELGTPVRREAVRQRLGRIGRFGAETLPKLAPELTRIADEPLPDCADEDDVWRVVCQALLADVAMPELN